MKDWIESIFELIGGIFEVGLFLLVLMGVFMLVIKCLIIIGNVVF